MNDWFHWLLVILPAIVAVQVVALNVDNGGALTEFTPNFIYFIFVEARCSIIWLHLRQATALFSWLRNGPFSVLILKLDSRLLVLDSFRNLLMWVGIPVVVFQVVGVVSMVLMPQWIRRLYHPDPIRQAVLLRT